MKFVSHFVLVNIVNIVNDMLTLSRAANNCYDASQNFCQIIQNLAQVIKVFFR